MVTDTPLTSRHQLYAHVVSHAVCVWMWSTVGNHERDFPGSGSTIGSGDSGGECGVPTQARFHMPTCAQPNTKPCIGTKHVGATATTTDHSSVVLGASKARRRGPVGSSDDGWYSFEQGPLHVIMLHTEVSSAVGSRQYEFVAADLAAVDREKTPWVIIAGHRQMYAGNAKGPQNALNALEPLLIGHKVDLAFWGHIHYAQRSCPMVNATCVTTTDAAGYDAPIHGERARDPPTDAVSTRTLRLCVLFADMRPFTRLSRVLQLSSVMLARASPPSRPSRYAPSGQSTKPRSGASLT